MKVFFITIAFVTSFSISFSKKNSGVVPWVAPAEADKLINPLFGNPFATAEGKKLSLQYVLPVTAIKEREMVWQAWRLFQGREISLQKKHNRKVMERSSGK